MKCPNRVPEMIPEMIQIIRASQEYEGLAWFAYDEAYRRQAAVTQHYEWSRINPSIFLSVLQAGPEEDRDVNGASVLHTVQGTVRMGPASQRCHRGREQ